MAALSMTYNARMLTFLKRRTLHVWIALMAVLFGALAPSISHALAASRNTQAWGEICSAAGTVKKSPSDTLQHHLEHCPYCATQGASSGLPPTAPAPLAIVAGHDFYPPLFYTAPAPLFSWAAAHPRGPPAFISA